MRHIVKRPRVRILSRCPYCGRMFAMVPDGWKKFCRDCVLMRVKSYRCRHCGADHMNLPPFVRA